MINFPLDQSGYIQVEGGRIWYRLNFSKTRPAKTPIIIIHGGPGSTHHSLLPCVELSQDRMVILYDQLGSGLSDKSDNVLDWTLNRFTNEINFIVEGLALKKYHLLGNSWGGSLAINYAARQPKGLRSIILSGPLVQSKRWIADNNMYKKQLPNNIQKTLLKYEEAQNYDHPDYIEAVKYFYACHLFRKKIIPEYVRFSLDNSNSDIYKYMWGPTEFLATGTLKNLDLTSVLSDITVPTLFVAGEYDEGSPLACKYFSRMMSNATLSIISKASHMPFAEEPNCFFKVVRDFLKKYD